MDCRLDELIGREKLEYETKRTEGPFFHEHNSILTIDECRFFSLVGQVLDECCSAPLLWGYFVCTDSNLYMYVPYAP